MLERLAEGRSIRVENIVPAQQQAENQAGLIDFQEERFEVIRARESLHRAVAGKPPKLDLWE